MYFTYLLRCADDTFYCGITNNLQKRLHSHNASKTGARYTRTRRPVELVYFEEFTTRSQSQIREAQIKKLTKKDKQNLVHLNSQLSA